MKYIIDLDGTLMNGEKANIDAVQFVNELQNRNCEFLVMTNSIKSPERIQERLKKVGIDLELHRIMNPICAMNTYNQSKGYESAYVVGSVHEIEQVHIEVVQEDPSVVMLLDFEKENVTYNELQKIFTFIRSGIPVITASKSPYYLKGGKQVLDTGAFVKLFESAAETTIQVLGKPSEAYFMSGLQLLRAEANHVTVIGDDWSTDIKGANQVGCKSVLVRSGKYKVGDESKCHPYKCVDKFMELF